MVQLVSQRAAEAVYAGRVRAEAPIDAYRRASSCGDCRQALHVCCHVSVEVKSFGICLDHDGQEIGGERLWVWRPRREVEKLTEEAFAFGIYLVFAFVRTPGKTTHRVGNELGHYSLSF
jgi:hypothetical protein